MVAKYAGTCYYAGDKIEVGEDTVFMPRLGSAHARCYAFHWALSDYTLAANTDGAALQLLIDTCKAYSQTKDKANTELWTVSRITRYFVPETPTEAENWTPAPTIAEMQATVDHANAVFDAFGFPSERYTNDSSGEPQVKPPAAMLTRWNVAEPLKKGKYTIVFEDNEQRTLKVSEPDENDGNKQFIGVLIGPDNQSDYLPIAVVNNGVAFATKALKAMAVTTHTRRALAWYLEADTEQRRAMGQVYAIESGNCYRCGRELTVKSSIDAGLGPICATK